jgi:UDP-GlcNAc3NAcA epimerase
MSKPRILTVVGTRPQYVKASVVSRAIREDATFEEYLVDTGQHYDDAMSRIFLQELEIPEPNLNLGVGSASHGVQTARMLEGIERALMEQKPNWVLVYGDTNSTIAGALAAIKLNIPVAHVEAGLRSFNRRMPEEMNRVATDHVSDLLLPPTEIAVRQLRAEGIPDERIVRTGDVTLDTSLFARAKADQTSTVLQRAGVEQGRFVLSTVHRAENTDDPQRLRSILMGLAEVSETLPVVLPLHPRTRGRLADADFAGSLPDSLKIIDPVGYIDMVRLESCAAAIATDSGGVQKEAFYYRVPCVTLRDETEWVETVELGWNHLTPPDSAEAVRDAVLGAIGVQGRDEHPYGTGKAASEILEALKARINHRR